MVSASKIYAQFCGIENLKYSKITHYLSVLVLVSLPCAQPKKPNVVIFLADDMGFSDIGAYGSEIATPNLDKLASEGVRFTQFYNTSRCCPTRASLLTGLYSHQAGVGHMVANELTTRGPGYGGRLNENCVTLAEVLKTAGYSTYMVGKWHVSNGANDRADWPMQRGFQRFFGSLEGPGSYFDSPLMINGNTALPKQSGTYSTYQVSDTAAGYIDQHVAAGKSNPFFLYVAHNAPHWPLQAPDSLVAKYKGKYLKGWTVLRRERFARERASGLLDSSWGLSQDDGLVWDTLSAAKKTEMDFRMAIYAAQVEAMDQGIGTVLNALKRNNLTQNTLVLFLSDNGGNREGGIAGGGPASDLGLHQTFPSLSYGGSWANASNTPFKEYKHFEFEGGISTPLIASWPNGIMGINRWEKQPAHLIDIMPTLVELSGATYPASVNGKSILPMEGISLVPVFTGKTLLRSNPLFWEHEGSRAVRVGKWKLVALDKMPWELYDMDADRSEIHNLAQKDPTRVKDMSALWDAWAVRAHVVWNGTGLNRDLNKQVVSSLARSEFAQVAPEGVKANGVKLKIKSRKAASRQIQFALPVKD